MNIRLKQEWMYGMLQSPNMTEKRVPNMQKPAPAEIPQRQRGKIGAESSVCRPFAHLEKATSGLPSKRKLLILAALVTVSFCLIVNNSWNTTPDSALYLALGESLARHDGYVFNGEPHTFVPPGFPLILAGTAITCGTNFSCYRTLMALMGLLSAGAAYLFIMRYCGPGCAFLAGGLFAVSYTLLHNSTLVLADVPFTLFTMIALNALVSAGNETNRLFETIMAGLCVGALALIRINGLGVAPAALFFLLCAWKDEKLAQEASIRRNFSSFRLCAVGDMAILEGVFSCVGLRGHLFQPDGL